MLGLPLWRQRAASGKMYLYRSSSGFPADTGKVKSCVQRCSCAPARSLSCSRSTGARALEFHQVLLAPAQDQPCRTGLVRTRWHESTCHVFFIILLSVFFLYIGYCSSSQRWGIGFLGSFNLYLSFEGQIRRSLRSSALKQSPPCFRKGCNWNQLIPSPLQMFPFQTTEVLCLPSNFFFLEPHKSHKDLEQLVNLAIQIHIFQ